MKRKLGMLMMAVLCLSLAGCSKDAEIDAFIADFDATTKEMVTKIDSNPTAAGIDAAQQAFSAKKPGLKQKWEGIRDAVGFQVSADTKKKLEDSVAANMKALMDVSTKNMMKLASDPAAASKFQALLKDYQSTFEPK